MHTPEELKKARRQMHFDSGPQVMFLEILHSLSFLHALPSSEAK